MDLLSSRRVYASPWFDVREDVVRGPDGRTADHAGCCSCASGPPAAASDRIAA